MDGLEKLYLLISTDGLNYLLPVSKIERILDGRTIPAVSYTHLDVYKRQGRGNKAGDHQL